MAPEVKPLLIPTQNGTFTAKPTGQDTIAVKGKDGTVQNMEIVEFKQFLVDNVPNINKTPTTDTVELGAKKQNVIDKGFNAYDKYTNPFNLDKNPENDSKSQKFAKLLWQVQMNPLFMHKVISDVVNGETDLV